MTTNELFEFIKKRIILYNDAEYLKKDCITAIEQAKSKWEKEAIEKDRKGIIAAAENIGKQIREF